MIGTLIKSVFVALFFLLNMQNAFAAEAFTVTNVEVDVRAGNAVQARELALEQARMKGFEKLIHRLLTEDERENLIQPEGFDVASMIQDFEVIEERLAPKRYIGKFRFRFKEALVRQYFKTGGVSFSDIAAQAVVILPYLQKDERIYLWESENVWLEAWRAQDTYSEGLVPIITPIGDLLDIQDAFAPQPLQYSVDKLKTMASRYDAGEVLIAFMSISSEQKGVYLYRTDQEVPRFVHSVTIDGDIEDLVVLENAVKEIYKFLQRDWKQQTSRSEYSSMATLELEALINGLTDWVDIRSRLDNVQGISGYDVLSLMPGKVRVRLHFDGGYERLSLALRQEGLAVEQPAIEGFYDESGAFYTVGSASTTPLLVVR